MIQFPHGDIFNTRTPRAGKAILVIIIAGFLTGTTTHLIDIFTYGFLGYHAPLPANLYWTALTVLDPLAAVLVLCRTRPGLLLGSAIMVSDIAVNSFFMVSVDIPARNANYFRFILQLLFFFLVISYSIYYFSKRPAAKGERNEHES